MGATARGGVPAFSEESGGKSTRGCGPWTPGRWAARCSLALFWVGRARTRWWFETGPFQALIWERNLGVGIWRIERSSSLSVRNDRRSLSLVARLGIRCGFFHLPFEGNDEQEKKRYFSTVFSEPMRYLSLSIFSILAAPNCYRPVGQNISPQGCESVAPPKGNESDPSRPAGGRLAWSLSLRGPQAAYPRKNALPKGSQKPEKGVSGEEPVWYGNMVYKISEDIVYKKS